jgi:putative membrane protein
MKAIHAALFSALALASFPGWAQSTGPTDPQIAAIVVTANQVDIDAGKLAESKTKSADVKAFAQRMVTDRSGVNQAAVDLVHKLGVTPQENRRGSKLRYTCEGRR